MLSHNSSPGCQPLAILHFLKVKKNIAVLKISITSSGVFQPGMKIDPPSLQLGSV
jgi:hypothetical protein